MDDLPDNFWILYDIARRIWEFEQASRCANTVAERDYYQRFADDVRVYRDRVVAGDV